MKVESRDKEEEMGIRPGTITKRILKDWESDISAIADSLCDPGGWSEEEWQAIYNDVVIPLRNAGVGLQDFIAAFKYERA